MHLRRIAAASSAALAVVGCSDRTDGAAPDATADQVGCLFCSDASEDLPNVVRVRNEIDQVCSITDCHGSTNGGMGLSPGAEFDAMINVTSTEVPPMKRVLATRRLLRRWG
jgi:hypothetical protein